MKGLFQLLEKIGCPPILRSLVVSSHEDMKGTVMYDESCSDPFPLKSGVKQGCVLAPTLFGIFFSLLLSHAFRSSSDGVYLHTRTDGKLFSIARLRAKTKCQKSSCATCYLPMTQPLQPTQKRTYRDLLTASLSHAKTLASPPASKRPMSVHKMSVRLPLSRSMITPWMRWMSSLILAPPSPRVCASTLK